MKRNGSRSASAQRPRARAPALHFTQLPLFVGALDVIDAPLPAADVIDAPLPAADVIDAPLPAAELFDAREPAE